MWWKQERELRELGKRLRWDPSSELRSLHPSWGPLEPALRESYDEENRAGTVQNPNLDQGLT